MSLVGAIRRGPTILGRTASHLVAGSGAPIVAWARSPNVLLNWGDALNSVLVHAICGVEPVWAGDIVNVARRPIYYVIGSGLGNLRRPFCEVWGTGFIGYSSSVKRAPYKIHAVRGPLSRRKFLDAGIDCPDVYGDPALLWPRYYSPSGAGRRRRIGIVAHVKDAGLPWLKEISGDDDLKVIDICGGITDVVDEITACDLVISSSLHGLIVADAYGVASTWVRFEEESPDRWFKYRDYLASVGRSQEEPVFVAGPESLDRVSEAAFRGGIDLDLDRLWDACPLRELKKA